MLKTTVVRNESNGETIPPIAFPDIKVPGIYRLCPIKYQSPTANTWRLVVGKKKLSDQKLDAFIIDINGQSIGSVDLTEYRYFVPAYGETYTVTFSDKRGI